MSKKYIRTLEFYGYGENNMMKASSGYPYKVKVSDKDGNIITIEKDGSLYAMVSLSFDANQGILNLLDVAHDNSILAEIEMPNAEYIYNCRFDESHNAILFDVKSLYGSETSTIELDVESLVELYEAGQGIEIGDKDEETGRRPISVKLADGEELLQLTDDGLGLDSKVVTEDELYAAISGKADVEYVDELFSDISGLTSGYTELLEIVETHDDEIEKLKNIVGTDEESPSLFEQISENREDISGVSQTVAEISGAVEDALSEIDGFKESIETISGETESLKNALEDEIERATTTEENLDNKIDSEIENRKSETVASVDYDSSAKTINFLNAFNEIIDSIDATDFIKDGMIDSVVIETIDDTTYLVITWNTDAGKEVTRIDIGDLFEADNYYTKGEIDEKVTALQEMDAALVDVDTQQWSAINQNRADMEAVDAQLWDAINAEITARTNADNDLQYQIDVEKEHLAAEIEAREDADAAIEASIDDKIAVETNRAMVAEAGLASSIESEIERAEHAEQVIEQKHDADIAELKEADIELKQYVDLKDANTNSRIDTLESTLTNEINERQEADIELASDIQTIKDTYATKEYVDTKDEEVRQDAIQTSINSAKTYTDEEVDELEAELKHYCDDGHQELLDAINTNATKINLISNLKEFPDGTYDDSGNGILDVLHREFHEYVEKGGIIESIEYDGENLIIKYKTVEGEKVTIIPIGELVDLSNYYTKAEVDYKLDTLNIDCGIYNI